MFIILCSIVQIIILVLIVRLYDERIKELQYKINGVQNNMDLLYIELTSMIEEFYNKE